MREVLPELPLVLEETARDFATTKTPFVDYMLDISFAIAAIEDDFGYCSEESKALALDMYLTRKYEGVA